MNPLVILSFIAIYLLFGRKIAVPYAVFVFHNIFSVIAVTFILEFLQIPLFYFVLEKSSNIRIFKNIRDKMNSRLKKGTPEKKIIRWARHFGDAGVFIVSALPSFGGGIMTATFLSFILKLEKKKSYLLILSGSLLCIIFLAFGTHLIKLLIK